MHAEHGARTKPLACRCSRSRSWHADRGARVALVRLPRGDRRRRAAARPISATTSSSSTRPSRHRPIASSLDGEVALTESRTVPWTDAATLLAEVSRALRDDGALVERLVPRRRDRGAHHRQARRWAAVRRRARRRARRSRRARADRARAAAGAPIDCRARFAHARRVDGAGRARLRLAPLGALASLGGGGGRVHIGGGDVAQAESIASHAASAPTARRCSRAGSTPRCTASPSSARRLRPVARRRPRSVDADRRRRRPRRARLRRARRPRRRRRDDVKAALRQVYAGVHHRAAMPPRFERALAATASLDLLRDELAAK